jgi:hypothetical protein
MNQGLLTRLRFVTARLAAPRREMSPPANSRHNARTAVTWFVVATVAVSGATLLATDVFAPTIRDPEYGRRAARLRDRVAENPERPLVMAVGSSRIGGAICPAAWEAMRPADSAHTDPMLFNLGRAGAGPIVQLMTLRRAYADGFRPAVVLLEYWPPVMNASGGSEFLRITPDNVFAADLPLIREYAQDDGVFERALWRNRANPIWGLRRMFMLQLDPEWLPWSKRSEVAWVYLDGWGWLPGPDLPPEPSAERSRYLEVTQAIFRPQFRTVSFAINPMADRALREAVALAREHGAAVGFVYLPESSEFRSWYPPRVKQRIAEHLAGLSAELNVPVIDSRSWLADGFIADGYHLTKRGAAEFTRKLRAAVAAMFGEAKP